MNKTVPFFVLLFFLMSTGGFCQKPIIPLPAPRTGTDVSLTESIASRKSVRSFADEKLTLEELSSLLWAAYGSHADGRKTVPSAGALYPVYIYIAAGNIEGLHPGVYRYEGTTHQLRELSPHDVRRKLTQAALSQSWMNSASCIIAICLRYENTTSKYGQRGRRYALIEAGAVCQNIALTAASLNLGATVVGAFDDSEVKRLLSIDEEPALLLPVGKPQ